MLREGKDHIFLNHLENIRVVTTKTELLRALKRHYAKSPEAVIYHYNLFDSTPTSFIVLSNSKDGDYALFAQRFKELANGCCAHERVPAKHCAENIWIVKPAAMNQGQGIEVFNNDMEGMRKFLESRPAFTNWVIQKYIERPLLYKNRKFDIRVWAVATWKNEIFYYKAGYLRTSSEEYALDSKHNYVHLTNNCLQRNGSKYGAHEAGNTVSFESFQRYVDETWPSLGISLEKHLVPRMKDLIIDSYLAGKNSINSARRRNSFELLGYDFLIDEDFRVWLIEVNTNPYIGTPNKFIEGLLPKMLNDLLELTLDVSCKPANQLPKRDLKNLFELLYSEKRKVNKRRSYAASLYPLPSLVPPANAFLVQAQKAATSIKEVMMGKALSSVRRKGMKTGAKKMKIAAAIYEKGMSPYAKEHRYPK